MTLSASTQAKLNRLGPPKFGDGRCVSCDSTFSNEWYFGDPRSAMEARHLGDEYMTATEFCELRQYLSELPKP